MRSLEMELLFPGKPPFEFRYRPVKLCHPATSFSYGIAGEWKDKHGKKLGSLLLPDVSRDYLFVFCLATKCTAAQLNPEQMLELLNKAST